MSEPVINIDVQTRHLPEHKDAEEKFAFAYQITVTNKSDVTVQLLNRYWLITDGNGHTSEVSGEGVVGKQPRIKPGESFQYTSGALIDTPVGSMQGYYEMETEDGSTFRANINAFSLSVPNSLH